MFPGETPALVQDRYSLPAICNHTAADAVKTKRKVKADFDSTIKLQRESNHVILPITAVSPCCNLLKSCHVPLLQHKIGTARSVNCVALIVALSTRQTHMAPHRFSCEPLQLYVMSQYLGLTIFNGIVQINATQLRLSCGGGTKSM